MTAKITRRTNLTVESLEGRDLQSGLVAQSQMATPALLPHVEQVQLGAAAYGQSGASGSQTRIIAILIG
jgi:hypothetical protein